MSTALSFLDTPAGQATVGIAGSILGGARSFSASRQQAAIFETQAASARSVADFNAKLERLQSDRNQEQFTRELQRTVGRQRVEIATTGLAATSKSFLQVQNETIQDFTRAMLQERLDATQREQAVRFEGERQAQDALSRARATRTQARTELLTSAFRTATQATKLTSLLDSGESDIETGSTGRIIGRV